MPSPSSVVLALALAAGCGGSGGAALLGSSSATSTGATSTGAGRASTTAAASTTTTTAADPSGTPSSTTGAADSTGTPLICGGEVGELQIGHGLGEYIALDEQPAELLHGPQGGVHITLAIRCVGLEVSRFGDVWLHGEVGGRVVADHPQGAVLTCDEDTGVAEGLWLSMVFEVGPEIVHGQQLDMEIAVTDDVGTTVMATAQTLVLDPLLLSGSDSSGSDSGTESGTSSTGG